MKRVPWLIAVALVLWGYSMGVLALGGVLASLYVAISLAKLKVSISDTAVRRLIGILFLVSLASLAVFSFVRGVPEGLYLSVAWLPVVWFSPLVLDAGGVLRLRAAHFFVMSRQKPFGSGGDRIQLGGPYVAFTLLCASLGHAMGTWFFAAAALVLCAWLYLERPKRDIKGLIGFAVVSAMATACAWGLSAGLRQAQNATQDLFIAIFSSADNDPYKSQTRIGDVGQVKLSEKIVWRVELAKQQQLPLLLRTGVFTRYASDQWFASAGAFNGVSFPAGTGAPLLTLHGKGESKGLLLPLPMQVSAVVGKDADQQSLGVAERNANGIVRLTSTPSNLDVQMWANGQDNMSAPGSIDLVHPKQVSAWVARIPELQAVAGGSDEQKLAALGVWFASNFHYTLYLGEDENARRTLERFLFEDRAGHCEYFATATVLLLRSLGVPARYVTGYSVQEYSELEQQYVVRLSHAHAWAQAFVNGKWVEVDNTPSSWVSDQEKHASMFTPIRDAFSYLVYRISQTIQGQKSGLPWELMGMALLIVVAIALALWRKRLWRAGVAKPAPSHSTNQGSANQLLQSFYALEREWATLGLGRKSGETPKAWFARVSTVEEATCTPEQMQSASELIDALYLQRYR